jgi:hypothetical protein
MGFLPPLRSPRIWNGEYLQLPKHTAMATR